jgi:hypothetical protein
VSHIPFDDMAQQGILAAVAAFFGGGWLRERRKLRHDALSQALDLIDRMQARIDALETQVAELQRELYRRDTHDGWETN